MSRKRRIRQATALPDSSRKIRSTAVTSEPADVSSDFGLILERPDFHRAPAGNGRFAGPVQSCIEICGLDDPETTDLLLGLRIGPIGDPGLTTPGADDGCGVGRV